MYPNDSKVLKSVSIQTFFKWKVKPFPFLYKIIRDSEKAIA